MLPLTPWSRMGPEGLEPPPCRLKGGYAAITPRPRQHEAWRFQRGSRLMSFSSTTVVRGGIAPATGDVSDRHATVTPPDHPRTQSVGRPRLPVQRKRPDACCDTWPEDPWISLCHKRNRYAGSALAGWPATLPPSRCSSFRLNDERDITSSTSDRRMGLTQVHRFSRISSECPRGRFCPRNACGWCGRWSADCFSTGSGIDSRWHPQVVHGRTSPIRGLSTR